MAPRFIVLTRMGLSGRKSLIVNLEKIDSLEPYESGTRIIVNMNTYYVSEAPNDILQKFIEACE